MKLEVHELSQTIDKHCGVWEHIFNELTEERVHQFIEDSFRSERSLIEALDQAPFIVTLFTDDQLSTAANFLFDDPRDVANLVLGTELGRRAVHNEKDYKEFLRQELADELGIDRKEIPDHFLDEIRRY